MDLKLISLALQCSVHCLFYVFLISFIEIVLLFTAVTHCAYDISSYNLIGHRIWYAYLIISLFPLSMEHCWYFYLNNETAAVMSIWMFLIALSVLLIYNFLSTPINEMFLLSRVLCVFSNSIFISINTCIQYRAWHWLCARWPGRIF